MKLPRRLVLLLLVAFLLRAGLVLLAGNIPLVGDEVDYDLLARQIWQGEGFGYGQGEAFAPTSYRAPGHPAWLALIYGMTGGSQLAARLGQSLLMTGVILVFFLLGRALFDDRVAWAGAVLVAFDPLLIAFSTWLWAEPLYLILMGVTFLTLLRATRLGRWRWLFLSGVAWGLATLTRESGLLLAALLGLWLLWAAWHARKLVAGSLWRYPLLFGLGFALVVAPWTWRNARVHGRFVPVTTVTGLALWLGNNPWGDWGAVFERYFQPETEVQREALAMREGLRAIQDAGALWLPRKVASNWPALLGPENFLLRQLRDGTYGSISAGVYGVLYAGTLTYWILVGAGGTVGLWFSVKGSRRSLLVLPIAATLVAHTLLHAHSRHRLPLLPILALGAGYAWCYRGPIGAQLKQWPPIARTVGALATLVMFFVLNIPFKREILEWIRALW